MHSFNETLERYRRLLFAQHEGRLQLPNENLDTGEPTGPTDYRSADETYAKLLDKVSVKPISGALRVDILAFYADPEAPFATEKNMNAWQNVLRELDQLKALRVAAVSD